MMIIKKSFFYTLFAALFCLQTSLVCTQDFNLDWEDDIADSNPENAGRFIDIFDDDDPFLDAFLSTPAAIQTRLTPEEILDPLVKGENKIIDEILAILQEDLFLRTTPVNKQSLLDMPVLGDAQCGSKDKKTFGFDLFYNQTSRSNFTSDSTNLSSYVSLKQESLIDKIEDAIKKVSGSNPPAAYDIDMRKLFGLFENMTVQERRLGSMFFWIQKWKNIIGHFRIPLYYLERNFWLNKDEQIEVEEELGALEPEEQKAFQKAHFISDKLGFGDTRIELETPLFEKKAFQANVGLQTTIPTAFMIAKSFMGSTFPRPATFPLFDFEKLLDLAGPNPDQQATIFKEITDFALCALDRVAANLLDAKLGNDGHFGLGFFVRAQNPLSLFIKKQWATEINWSNKISIEYLFPRKEKRFYIEKVNPQDYAARDFEDLTKAEENLAFLEQEIVNRIFLLAFPTRVQPGIIFHWTSKLCHQGKWWGWTLGSDFWFQSKDHLSNIDVPNCCDPTTTCKRIDVQKAEPFSAYRLRLFGGLSYKIERPNRTWLISLNVDGTPWRSGIGRDFSVFFKLEKHF